MNIAVVVLAVVGIALGAYVWELGTSRRLHRALTALAVVVASAAPALGFLALTLGHFRSDGRFTAVSCDGGTRRAEARIGDRGFEAPGCVRTRAAMTFVNAGTARVELCVGVLGDCWPRSDLPRSAWEGITLEPGQRRAWALPPHSRWLTPFERRYPLTVREGSSLSAPDLVLRVEVPPDPPTT
ncbi:hypothetical protein [Actinocorallia longicatena]|uniref:DUF2393 domain-containing protein n=1 Tax=Actinocorallia longicatena TaxID=111803 RepID=A0ABP6QIK1_9ACTN